jgi:hypothetical protein
MAKRLQASTKRLMISKANSTIVIAVGAAAFITAFALVTSAALLSKRSYQAKVIGLQEEARDQLKENLEAVDTLKNSYEQFVDRQQNLIGGSSIGTGDRDGDNAKLILDSLPSKYDYPGLASSLEKILVDRNYKINSITGVDEEAIQNAQQSDGATSAPPPTSGSTVDMPFEIQAEGSYTSVIDLLTVFQRSIRPLHMQRLTFSAVDASGNVELTIVGKSYFQPEKPLKITDEVVK